MNIIKTALKEAGIKVPIKRRIWNWLRDHPNKTAREISTALNEKITHVRTELRDMTMRGMVKHRPVLHKPYRGVGRKTVYEYMVTTAEFEILPYAAYNAPSTSTVDVVKSDEPVKPLVGGQLDVQSLPLAEARRIYEELKEIFG